MQKGWTVQKLDTRIRLAMLEDHPWNADSLDIELRGMTMPERDASWTLGINNINKGRHPLWELIYWSLACDIAKARTETLRLASITLKWVFTSSNPN
jgi:hypothetical protein